MSEDSASSCHEPHSVTTVRLYTMVLSLPPCLVPVIWRTHSSRSMIFIRTRPSSTSMRRQRLSTEVNPTSHMRSAVWSQPSVVERRRRRLGRPAGWRWRCPTSTSSSCGSTRRRSSLVSPTRPYTTLRQIEIQCSAM